MANDDQVFENGWHTGLGFPQKPMVLLEGCNPSRPEYYRAVVVRVEERKRLVMLRWVHVPGQQLFKLPLGSPRIWTHSYKNEHWTQLQRKKGAWRPRPIAKDYIYTPVAA
ncbi:hypothetical protein OEZ86_004301 [Tetradesmus obliquus]|nr:hypothetical protein OEZ86_004301 [Tetradesmus obliquus]